MGTPLKNSELLSTPKHQLTAIERQRAFLIRMQGDGRTCPSCNKKQTPWDAVGLALDDYPVGQGMDGHHRCMDCDRPLKFLLPFVGDWYWGIDFDREAAERGASS